MSQILIRKHFTIVLWLFLIGWFAPSPLFLRGEDECRRALSSFRVEYAALFYKLVGRLFMDAITQETFENFPLIFGDLFLEELGHKIEHMRGMAYNAHEADEWELLVLRHSVLQCAYFLASQAIIYREAYVTIRAENNLQTQQTDAQLAEENIFEIMRNVKDYFPPPAVNSEILKYELSTIADLPLIAFLYYNTSDQRPTLFVEQRYSRLKFLYEPSVAERPHIAGYFRTPVKGHPDWNMFNEYTILLRALSCIVREYDGLANRSLSLKYSDYFLAIVPSTTLTHAQTFVRGLFANSSLTVVVEYQFIVMTFLRTLLDFLFREYNWELCHPMHQLLTEPLTKLWTQIVELVDKNVKSYENAHNVFIKSRNLQDKMDALYNFLKDNIQVGYTLRADIGAAIADNTMQKG